MPGGPIVSLAAKLLWEESQPLRKALWDRLAFAKDAGKRNFAEEQLSLLLEDSHKLAKSLSPEQAEAAIDKRMVQFHRALLEGKIPKDQAQTFATRGELFVKLLVTEPVADVSLLAARVAELEVGIANVERELASAKANSSASKTRFSYGGTWFALMAILILQLVLIFLVVTPMQGGGSR